MRERVRGRRGLVYLYVGLLTGVAAVLVVWPLPSLLTRHPRVVDAAGAAHRHHQHTRTGLVAMLAAGGAAVGLAYTARTYRLSRGRPTHRSLHQGRRTARLRQDRGAARRPPSTPLKFVIKLAGTRILSRTVVGRLDKLVGPRGWAPR